MKRIVAFMLVVILTMGCLGLPVYAAELETGSEVMIISDQRMIKDQTINSDVYITSAGVVTFENVVVNGNIYCHGQLTAKKLIADGVYAYAYGSSMSCDAFDGTHGLVTGEIIADNMYIKDNALEYAFATWEEPKEESRGEPKEEQPLGMEPIGPGGYVEMTSSQMLVDMIKVMEGFSATPFWDYAQYTIGYGCNASQPEGFIDSITPEEAEELLKRELAENYEKTVNRYCRKIGKQPSQNQFDALVSFTYNVGSSWMSGSRVDLWLRNPSTELEFVNAIGQWCRAGSDLLFGLAQRRIREAIIFLKGEYSLPYEPTKNHNVKSELRVISNGALPYYTSVIYQYDYTTSSVTKGCGHAVQYYFAGGNYDNLRIPAREGYQFEGWKITRINGNKTTIGGMVDAMTVVEKNLELTALWTEVVVPPTEEDTDLESEDSEDATEPEEETEPTEETEPAGETEPTEETDPSIDTAPTEETESTEATEPTDETEPAQETEPSVDTAPTEETESTEATEPTEETESTEATEPTEETESTEATEPTEETESTEATEPTEETESTEATEPTEETESTEATEPTEDTQPEYVMNFRDVAEDAWYHDAVRFVCGNGYMNGVGNSSFNPQGTMSRAMLVTVLYRLDGQPEVTDEERDAFDDIADMYYTDAVAWAKANGIVNGVSQRQFAPNRNVSRQDAVAILYRFCVEYKGIVSEEARELTDFLDAIEVAEYAEDPMRWAVAVGLINGTTTTDGLCLNPLHNLSRCENAAILMRFVNEILN